jgi:hypothetical protein
VSIELTNQLPKHTIHMVVVVGGGGVVVIAL